MKIKSELKASIKDQDYVIDWKTIANVEDLKKVLSLLEIHVKESYYKFPLVEKFVIKTEDHERNKRIEKDA